MRVAVIVVNYGTPDLSIEAVSSVVARKHDGHDVEIHLVDNASPGNDADLFAEAKKENGWDQVTLWAEERNHGFGRGNNLVLKALQAQETPPDYVFLLNPDARLENEAIAILVDTLETHADSGAVGAGILEPPDNHMVTACFRYPTALGEIERVIGFGPVSRLLDRYRSALPPDTPAGVVDWVAGASVMFRFKAIEEIGFFDPGFFLYFEEVDLMRRLANAGWTTRYQPAALVVHAAGASTNVQSGAVERRRRPPFVYRSWRRYFTKSHGRAYALATALAMTAGVAIGRILAALRGRTATRQPLRFFTDQWRYVLSPLMGLRQDPEYDREGVDIIKAPVRRQFTREEGGFVNTNPPGIGFWALVAEDLRTHEGNFFAQGFWALFWQRFGNWRMSIRWKVLRAPMTLVYRTMYKVTQWTCGIDLPFSVIVGRRVKLEHFGGMILIAERIGDDVIIRHNTTFGIARLDHPKDRPLIGDGVEIGVGSVIVGRIIVGHGAIVGANSLVIRDVPPGVVVGGVPARILHRDVTDVREKTTFHG